MILEREYLIRFIHGASERVTSAEYFFDNRGRSEGEYIVLQRTRRGRGFFEYEGERRFAGEGEAMLFTQDEASSYGFVEGDKEPYELDWIAFEGGVASVMVKQLRLIHGSVFALPEDCAAFAWFQRVSRFGRSGGREDRFKRSIRLYELLHALFQLPADGGAALSLEERAYELILNEFSSASNIKEIAGRLGCSREHLTRRFSERFGEPPAEMLRELRLRRAGELLRTTTLDVAEAARLSGLPDSNSFQRLFKRRYLKTPSEYREQR